MFLAREDVDAAFPVQGDLDGKMRGRPEAEQPERSAGKNSREVQGAVSDDARAQQWRGLNRRKTLR